MACSLYQVKRYETLSDKLMTDIVKEYAGPPRLVGYDGPKRRIDPHRFVIVTSASVESDTGNVDGLKGLQDAYQGDLTIEVWGAEVLGRKLRDAPHTVLAIFDPAWAKAWCGFEPAPAPPGAPPPLGLVEGPIGARGAFTFHRRSGCISPFPEMLAVSCSLRASESHPGGAR
jgi:hypothetical protein